MSSRCLLPWLALWLLAVSCVGFADIIERVSVSGAGTEGDGDSRGASVTPDGRFLGFTSDATNLVPGDTNGARDVFVRDRLLGTVERVSVSSDGVEGDDHSGGSPISADGRYVTFSSSATNLVPGDTNGVSDIFVRDRFLGITERVTVSSEEVQADEGSSKASISADGRYVVFMSTATNLAPGDTNGLMDIFVRDRLLGTTECVSVSSEGEEANINALCPQISADGRFVAFHSMATNLVPEDTYILEDAFVRDRLLGITERVSVSSEEAEANGHTENPDISGDGRYVVFRSDATNLVPGDTNGERDVFVRDRLLGTTERVSVGTDAAQGNGQSDGHPKISEDGRHVTFESYATDLVPGDTNGAADVFVHDRALGTTVRVSVNGDGVEGNGRSREGSISADGRYVTFSSYATNLVPGDTNGVRDAFVRDLAYLAPAADFSAAPVEGYLPLEVSFTDLSHYDPTSWVWDFGDGQTSTEQNPTHAYSVVGTHTVSLTVSNETGSETKTKADYITVFFPDVGPDHWACEEVMGCVAAGIVAGYEDGLYHPEIAVTRDQMAVYIARALEVPSGEAALADYIPADPRNFPDVAADFWAYRHIEYCVENAVVKGYEDGYYHPEHEVTRDQMAVYVARALVAPEGEAGLADYMPAEPRNFPDVPSDFWAYAHIEYCVENAVVKGYEDGLYRPEVVVTHQMAVYVARAFGLM
jgi:PKD repeat protein